jgi:hypothetical protein
MMSLQLEASKGVSSTVVVEGCLGENRFELQTKGNLSPNYESAGKP